MFKDEIYALLKAWCDRLLDYQITDDIHPEFDGALSCPSCMTIHGRCHDAVYPLIYMADRTGQKKYMEAAKRLFDWGDNLVADDGSFYNDAQNAWNGITTFAIVGMSEVLKYHQEVLDETFIDKIEQRMSGGALWIYKAFMDGISTNINYYAAASAALDLVSGYSYYHTQNEVRMTAWRERFRDLARDLAGQCMNRITEEGFLYGEGKPLDRMTKRGCRAVDIGYNMEESMPSLLYCAYATGNSKMADQIKQILYRQLEFMLPDGGWDNSFGTRNFKWTYWGSRTSDGCLFALTFWGQKERALYEAAKRNFHLLKRCTYRGLLYGGPDYRVHGEKPCTHHTFCHAKDLAAVLDHWKAESNSKMSDGTKEEDVKDNDIKDENININDRDINGEDIEDGNTAQTVFDQQGVIRHYPSVDTYRVSHKSWIATVTANDFEYVKGGHASGGVLSLLWHSDTGPILLSSITNYSMVENLNMQLSLKKAEHYPLTPGVELEKDGETYRQCYDYRSVITVVKESAEPSLVVTGELADIDHIPLPDPVKIEVRYTFFDDSVTIKGKITRGEAERCRYILPVIGRKQRGYKEAMDGRVFTIPSGEEGQTSIRVSAVNPVKEPEPIFCLAGGFEAWRFAIDPDRDGSFSVKIEIANNE